MNALRLALFVLVSIASSAQLTPTSFKEDYLDKDKVPVSGHVVVGAQFESQQNAGLEVIAFIPPKHPSHLCLSILSSNGRYWASADYKVEGEVGPRIKLKLPSKYGAILGVMKANEVALGGQFSDDCEMSTPTQWTSVAWSERDLGSRLVFLVNSNGYTISVFDAGKQSHPDCTKMPSAQKDAVAFDTVCEFSKASTGVLWSGAILRSDFDRRLPDILLKVWVD
jgi:hypothetical protein